MARKKGKDKGKNRVMLILFALMAAVFMPTTVLLLVGMFPTFVAYMVDRSKHKTKVITVGALNLAGCFPFLLELWEEGNGFEKSFLILADINAGIVMYSAAAIGYLLDWSLSGIVASVMYQRGTSRQKAIELRQQELVQRWGEEVTGRIELDAQGFAKKTPQP